MESTVTPTPFNPEQELFIRALKVKVEAAEDAARYFREKIAKHGLLDALRWAEDFAVTVATGDFARSVLSDLKEEGAEMFYEVVEHHRIRLTKRLLNDEWRGSSTSAYANAGDAATRRAASSFLERTLEGRL